MKSSLMQNITFYFKKVIVTVVVLISVTVRRLATTAKKMKSERETPWEPIRYSELMESDFSIYDDLKEPYHINYMGFEYKNKAQMKVDEEIRVAMDHYRKRSCNLTSFDAISAPEIAELCGGIGPIHIDDDDRCLLTSLCKLALDKYNAENLGANFVFVDIVKSTMGLCSGCNYYMTFQVKDANYPSNNSPVITFQAKVWDRIRQPPVVTSCAMKPT